MKTIKECIKSIVRWTLQKEIEEFQTQIISSRRLKDKLKDRIAKFDSIIDVSVDVHEYNKYSPSWAVISLQGQKTDYIKFIDLGKKDVSEIANFLRQFERARNIKVDASPSASQFLRIKK